MPSGPSDDSAQSSPIPQARSSLPETLVQRAEALLSGDTSAWEAPPLRDAATVILLMDAPKGPQVFLQRRVPSMEFAAGMYVFPGGKVELTDASSPVPWQPGPRAEPFARPRDAGPTATYRALATAAVRETWEEANVVLAQCASGTRLQETPNTSDEPLLPWLATRDAVIAADKLRPWAHWLTPEVERRRFDTRFLVAELPPDQDALDLGVESYESLWLSPAAALDRVRAGQMPMLPPTVDALQQLSEFETVPAILAEADTRAPQPLLPGARRGGDGSLQWVLSDAYSGEVLRRW